MSTADLVKQILVDVLGENRAIDVKFQVNRLYDLGSKPINHEPKFQVSFRAKEISRVGVVHAELVDIQSRLAKASCRLKVVRDFEKEYIIASQIEGEATITPTTALHVGLSMAGGASSDEVLSTVRELALKLDRLHRLYGGSGLKLDETEIWQFVQEVAPHG